MPWLDGFFSAYNTIRNAGLAFTKRQALNFVGLAVTDDPNNAQTTVTLNEKSIPVNSGTYGAVQTLIAEVDLTVGLSGTAVLTGCVSNATLGGSWTSSDIWLGYGTSTPIDTVIAHDVVTSARDGHNLSVSGMVANLTKGTTYRFGLYIKSNGDNTTIPFNGGGLVVRESGG